MHRLGARVRKLERKLPELDISDFTDEELTELVRLLIRHHFRSEVSWAQGYFLMHSCASQKEWCELVRDLPEISPAVFRDWFDIRARAMVSYYPGTAPDDVTVTTYRKLHAQIGVWERFVKHPDWAWLFRTVAVVRDQSYLSFQDPLRLDLLEEKIAQRDRRNRAREMRRRWLAMMTSDC
jgi:hypothetical protein